MTKHPKPGAAPLTEEPLDQRNVVALVQSLLANEGLAGKVVLDGTAGNGHDTAFLASGVGPAGRVVAIDVAAAAIEATRARLGSLGCLGRVELLHGDHGALKDLLPAEYWGAVDAAVFNLGYHPGGDREHATHAASTVPALESALAALRPGGLLCVAVYTGHAAGAEEAVAVRAWGEGLARTGAGAVRLIRDEGFELDRRPEVVVVRKGGLGR